MGKRTKQYKKLMRSFEFLGFRAPYQLLMTSDIVLDTIKVDAIALFEKTLSTKEVKPMITQCCIRALYDQNKGPHRDPAIVAAIERAKTFERRRCGHLMDEAPLSERECMLSVVDPKRNGQNKFRYIVATQDDTLRERLRSVVPTPLMYVRRSVFILEPMSAASSKLRDSEERAKFKDGIVRVQAQKRKRDDEESNGDSSDDENEGSKAGAGDETAAGQKAKKKKSYGPKGPNPLAVKKVKKVTTGEKQPRKPAAPQSETTTTIVPAEPKAKRKRRKKTSAAVSADKVPEGQDAGATIDASVAGTVEA